MQAKYEKKQLVPDKDLNKRTTLENVQIENIYYLAKPDYYKPAVCAVSNAELCHSFIEVKSDMLYI